MEPGGRLWNRGWSWTAGWPGGPEAAAPPLPASGGGAQLQQDLHHPPHTAYSKRQNMVGVK